MKDIPQDILCLLQFEHRKQTGPQCAERLAELANTTLPKTLTGIVKPPMPCTDCGKTVIDRQTIKKLCDGPYPIWRENCINCKLYKDPVTKEFCLTYLEFNRYVKEKVRLKKESLRVSNDK